MKHTLKPFVILLLTALFTGANSQSPEYLKKINEINKRTEWFREARFGMFIHWGVYSVPARGEWVRNKEKISNEEYQKYVDTFVPSNYKPEEWAKLAKEAGMKYAVLTAKHHDGFCMYDSKFTKYKITTNMPGRDLIKEYIDAFKKEGLKVGLYYSLIDWHHENYPNVANHPMRDNEEYSKKNYKWDKYLEYMHNQIEELMTNYGKIDILWLDYSFDDYYGEKWKAGELVKMIRKHQPEIILNNRLVINHGVTNKKVEFFGYGDFLTPEQGIPETKMVDEYGNNLPWEVCLTLNNSWGYHSGDDNWKSSKLIINSLVNCVSKNGNMLLNVGPDSQGNIPEQSVKTLKEVGAWLKVNGESIYGCVDFSAAKPDWGYYTISGNTLYAHLTNPLIGHINIGKTGEKVKEVSILNTGQPAATSTKWFGNKEEGNFFINIQYPTFFTYKLPDEVDTVFKIILSE